jgi:hypothetical protein
MPQGTNDAGTSSSQYRGHQPKRQAANDKDQIEKHGQAKAKRVRQGNAGDLTTGKDSSFGLGFDGGGNSIKGVGEKHSTWGSGKSRAIPSNVEVEERTGGNSARGEYEQHNQPKGRTVSQGTDRLGKGD